MPRSLLATLTGISVFSVLNRLVITALKGRYAERWLCTFYSTATMRLRYLPLRSVALIARLREIVGLRSARETRKI